MNKELQSNSESFLQLNELGKKGCPYKPTFRFINSFINEHHYCPVKIEHPEGVLSLSF
jgi:hypothetical protein